VGERDRTVYSSEHGRLCALCGLPAKRCQCRANPRRTPETPAGDGVVRVGRESKGRRGKTVTTVRGVPLAGEALRELLAELKRLCGTGGAVKDEGLEIQGDHRDRLVGELEQRGFRVKRTGG